MSTLKSPVQKALKSAYYADNGSGKKVKTYLTQETKEVLKSNGTITGDVTAHMKKNNIGMIAVGHPIPAIMRYRSIAPNPYFRHTNKNRYRMAKTF